MVDMQFAGSFASRMSGFYNVGDFIGKILRIQLFCEPCLFFAAVRGWHIEVRLAVFRCLGGRWSVVGHTKVTESF